MIKIACATDDGKNFTKVHFGSAKYYLIFKYEEYENRFKFVSKIENIPFEEKKDGDPEKANHVSNILKKESVNVIANKAIGPNIVRMRKKYVPVISSINNIEEALCKVDINLIKLELEKPAGEDKKVIYIK